MMDELTPAVRDVAGALAELTGGERSANQINELAAGIVASMRSRILGDPVPSSTSDGYHTFDELYRYRMLYHAAAVRGWVASGVPVVKSRRHDDGELCCGGGWFIVVADLPTGQVSNHYSEQDWELFVCPEVARAPAWDLHTPAVAAERLRQWVVAGAGGAEGLS